MKKINLQLGEYNKSKIEVALEEEEE